MSILRYYLGNRRKDQAAIADLIENIDLEDYQKKYLTVRIPEILSIDFDKIAIQSKLLFQLFKVLTIICGILVPVFANFNHDFRYLD